MIQNKIYFILFNIIGFISLNGQSILTDMGYQQEEVFPLKIDHFGFPNVEIYIEDSSYWIIWDTGNMIGLVISEEIISQHNFTLLDSMELYDSEGKVLGSSNSYSHKEVEVLRRKFNPKRIASTSQNFNGLVGPKFVQPSLFTLDYANKSIGISIGNDKIDLSKGKKIQMVRSSAFPYLIIVEGILNGQPILIELDTGKSRTVIDPEMISKLNLKSNSRGVEVKELEIAGIKFSFSNGKVKNFHGISESLPSPIRIGLGSDFLKDFIFSVDYQKGVVTFLPYGN